jgi:hypothetical protein
VLESAVLFITYFGVLLFATGQKAFYLDLIRGLKGSSSVKKEDFVSAL